MSETTVTSLRINTKILKTAKKAAIDWDITLGDLIEKAVTEWVKNHPVQSE